MFCPPAPARRTFSVGLLDRLSHTFRHATTLRAPFSPSPLSPANRTGTRPRAACRQTCPSWTSEATPRLPLPSEAGGVPPTGNLLGFFVKLGFILTVVCAFRFFVTKRFFLCGLLCYVPKKKAVLLYYVSPAECAPVCRPAKIIFCTRY